MEHRKKTSKFSITINTNYFPPHDQIEIATNKFILAIDILFSHHFDKETLNINSPWKNTDIELLPFLKGVDREVNGYNILKIDIEQCIELGKEVLFMHTFWFL